MFNLPVLRSGSTSVLGHTYGLMTTTTTTFQRGGGRSRSSGPQQHDGVVLQVELEEVEAPQRIP